MLPLCSPAVSVGARQRATFHLYVLVLSLSLSLLTRFNVSDLQVAQSQNKVYLNADSLVLNLQDSDMFK